MAILHPGAAGPALRSSRFKPMKMLGARCRPLARDRIWAYYGDRWRVSFPRPGRWAVYAGISGACQSLDLIGHTTIGLLRP